MTDSVVRLRLESSEYDQKLKRAAEGLQRYADGCRKIGGTLEVVEKDTLEYVKALGSMEATSRSASGKLSEMRKTFVELSMQYKQLTDQEKQSPFGTALNASLQQLKGRINETKNQLADVNKELNMSGGKFGEFGNIIDTIGSKFGVSGNLTEMLTSRTAMLTGAVGAGIAIVTKATEAWAGYNAELAKQDQITTVTTGLKDDAANQMTDQARALADTYNVDFREAINAANTLMTQFGESSEQAMQLIKDGMQGMIQGDGPKLLQMIQQYAPAFRDAGVSASQLIAVIQNSEGGIFTDQNMNAIVMGIKNIRLMTKATSDALAQLGIDGQKMSQQLSDGSLTVFDALKQVSGAIQGVDSNSKAAGEVMQQVFGRQGVTAGTNLGKAIETLNTNLQETKKQTGEVGDALAELQTANEKLNKAIRDCFEYDGWDQMAKGIQATLVTALATVLNYIGKIKGSLTDFVGGGIKAGEAPKPEPKYSNGSYWEQRDANGNVTSGRYWNNQQVSQSEYDKLRKSIIVPPSGNIPKGGGGKQTPDPIEGSIDAQTKKVQDLQKAWRAAADDKSREDIKKQIEQAQNVLDVMNGKTKLTDISIKADTSEALEKLEGIEGVTIDPKDVTINADTSDSLEKLKGIEGVTIDPKDFSITADTTEALAKIQDIEGITIAPKQVKFEVVDMKSLAPNGLASLIPDTYTRQQQGLTELKQKVKLELDAEALKADTETLKTILKDAIQNGITGMDFQLMGLGDEIAKGFNIPDEKWNEIIEQYNAKLKEKGLGPLNIDIATGKTDTNKGVKASDDLSKMNQDVSKMSSSINGIFSGIQQMGFDIPEGMSEMLGALQGMTTIMTSITAILSVIEATTSVTAATSAVKSIPVIGWALAHGGIVHAAGGYQIPGNHMSGDMVPAMVNSGELVLNKAQQGNLASQLQDNERGGGYTPSHVSGEQIWIALNNFTRRTGRGELVTWK